MRNIGPGLCKEQFWSYVGFHSVFSIFYLERPLKNFSQVDLSALTSISKSSKPVFPGVGF